MAINAILTIEAAERRDGERWQIEAASTLRAADRRPYDVVIEDLSRTGAAIRAPLALAIGEQVTIGLPNLGQIAARIVRRDGTLHGAEFLDPLTEADVARGFAGDPVFHLDRPLVPGAVIDTAAPDRWPVAARVAVILGVTLALWAVIIAGVMTRA
ncbi:MAG: PilZ domain-containing protein [Sphingomonas sp.]|nr:PilZ domain-containing protein [Sphingomonas sp.]